MIKLALCDCTWCADRLFTAISLLWIITFGEMLFWSFLSNFQDTGGTLSFVVSNANNLTFGHSFTLISTRFMFCPHPKSPFHPPDQNTTFGHCRHFSAQRYLDAHDYPNQGWIALSSILPLKEHSGYIRTKSGHIQQTRVSRLAFK